MRRHPFVIFALLVATMLVVPAGAEAQYEKATVASFATTSTTFVDVPGGALSFYPATTSDVWVLLFSAKLASSSVGSASVEARYLVSGVEHGVGGESSNPAGERGMWQHFYRVTGVSARQDVEVQLRDINGATATIEDLQIIAFRLPAGADVQFAETEPLQGLPAGSGFVDVETLSFTPSGAGDYVILALATGHEDPGVSYMGVRLEAPDASLWPVDHDLGDPDLGHFEYGRRAWRSFFLARVETLDATPKTYRLQAVGDPTSGSEIRYTRLMAFRADAFEAVESVEDVTNVPTNSTTPVVASTLTTTAPPGPRDYIVLQSVTLWANASTTDERRAGFEYDDIVQSSVAQITNNLRSSVGYTRFDAVTTSSAVKLENTFSTSNAAYTVNAKESVIHALRLPTCSPTVNLRSIGLDGGVLASAGTASINAGQTIVTFSNVLPAPAAAGAVGPGDLLVVGGEPLYILTRDSDTSVTVQTPALADHIGAAYSITRAYSGATPIQDWENDRDGDLVVENRLEIGVAYKDAALPFDENVTIDGSSTDACRYMWLTVAEGQNHAGVAASAPGDHVVVDPAAAGHAFTVRDDFTRIGKLEVTGWTGNSAEAVRIEAFDLLFERLLVHDDVATAGEGDGFHIGDGVSYTATIRNTIIYNVTRAGVYIQQSATDGDPILNLENVTVYNCGSGTMGWEGGVLLARTAGNPVINAHNVVSLGNNCGGGCSDADFKEINLGPFDWGTSTNNMSSDATAKGANPLTGRAASDQFVSTTPGAEDLHLRFGADAMDTAADLSAQFYLDVDGQSRQGLTWDRGADEAFCKLYWTEEATNKIRRSDLDGSNPELLLTFAGGNEVPRGIALHIAAGKMYWAEGGTRIRRADLDGSNLEDVVTGLGLPRDVDIDPVGGKIYWTDQNTGKLQRANFDGTGIEDLVLTLNTSRAGPALDLVNGKMYWTEDGGNRIRRANLDGSGVQALVTGLSGPIGIALDVAAGKMYWTDYGTAKIQRANLDGTGVEDLVTTGLLGPRGIEIDTLNGKMYWADYGAGKVQRANLDGSAVEDLHVGIDTPNGVALGCPTVAATAVALTSFTARGLDSEVLLEWETGSELENLGFHLYRATVPGGPYERVTERAIPGLGSSPQGARYQYRDSGLANGVTFYYKLEDIDTSGLATLHGPVSATTGETTDPSPGEERPETSARITVGSPESNAFEITRIGRNVIELTLHTRGFYALPLDDGTVALEIPEFVTLDDLEGPSMPVRHAWIALDTAAHAGVELEIASVRTRGARFVDGLRPASVELSAYASPSGAIRFSRSRRSAKRSLGLVPSEEARVLEVGFQGALAKASVELAPLRWDGSSGRLVLAETMVVRLVQRAGRKSRAQRRNEVPAFQLATGVPGVYAVSYESLGLGRGSLSSSSIRLSRLGEAVAFHVEPRSDRFGPGSVLYFVSEGGALNPYGKEAVFELSWSSDGKRMATMPSPPSGAAVPAYRHRLEREENRHYHPTLTRAPDLWLWDHFFAPAKRAYAFHVAGLDESLEPSRLELWLQGTSDTSASPDHHVRIWMNGRFAGEAFWDGKTARKIDVTLPFGVLVEGTNRLEVENVGDTEANYSLVMLDKFAVTHSRLSEGIEGTLHGRFTRSGTAHVGVSRAIVLDVTGGAPKWLDDLETDDTFVRFRAEAGSEYWVVGTDALETPRITRSGGTSLRDSSRRADLVVIGPRDFEPVALLLIEHRRAQGLDVLFAAVEDIYAEFGHGEPRPEALREFLAHAYESWQAPKLRYVLLLGDATFDYKDYYGLGLENHVPPLLVQTRFLRTVSDPGYAMIHGDDRLPDVAIGRLPASDPAEARAMVSKVLAFEAESLGMNGPIAFVADNADRAGNFEAHAEELAEGLLADSDVEKIYLSRLGAAEARSAVRKRFDDGASLMSYLGHGGIHLWADENLLDNEAVTNLGAQPRTPVLLTMNCLNGYFHFPFGDSLSEALLAPEDRGVVAAFSPSGLSFDAAAHRYHEALLREILRGGHERLGDAILAAQADYAATGAEAELLAIFHLLGDPTLVLR